MASHGKMQIPWRLSPSLGPSLPYLKPLLVEFCKGALETWKRFTAEFEEGGIIDQLTPEREEKSLTDHLQMTTMREHLVVCA
jgi:hypothetical protein